MRDLKKENEELSKQIESLGTRGSWFEEMNDLKKEKEELAEQIGSLSIRGSWCGYQDVWNSKGTVTYDRLTFSNSNNMEITGTPLDINTGINSNK